MLAYLANKAGHEGYGWGIIRWLKEHRGISISRGAVYKILEKLEERGLVNSRLGDPEDRYAGGRRHYYRLTATGEVEFHRQCREMGALTERLDKSIAEGRQGLKDKRDVG